ncbi:MAG: HutD family protein [Sphingopyxis sp.]|uniref:HutD/Ves family protein n=1 Tax=Sphingopyxis sp. TaxID=1908224 RepID=UPI001A464662|nr:HutD family protein [Sphingopyxis sp.]MBL9069992.1 HutD family protein [Sphingopyxis sp.]
MSGTRLLRAADRAARPWKNGGGVTRDVAVFPEGASDADFLWRASIATIAQAGPFSSFPGVDRAFLLLRGELAITVGDQEERRLRPSAPTLVFAGEDRVEARPVGENCTALNIMTRRGRVSMRVGHRVTAEGAKAIALLVFALESTALELREARVDLAPGDALLIDRPADLVAIQGAAIAAEFFYAAA